MFTTQRNTRIDTCFDICIKSFGENSKSEGALKPDLSVEINCLNQKYCRLIDVM